MSERAVLREAGMGYRVSFHFGAMPAHSITSLDSTTLPKAIDEAHMRWPRFRFRAVTPDDDVDGDVVGLGE